MGNIKAEIKVKFPIGSVDNNTFTKLTREIQKLVEIKTGMKEITEGVFIENVRRKTLQGLGRGNNIPFIQQKIRGM